MGVDQPRWKVGELARATGLTVRTLHHYDEIGLLVPRERTYGRHRVYTADDVRRLYRILALRELGLGLDEIAEWLERGPGDPRDLVRHHLAQVDEWIGRYTQLRERLAALLATLSRQEEPSAADFLDAIEAMTVIEKYYTAEQLDRLARRREQFGEEAVRAVEREWRRLYERAQALLEAGRDPADPDAQALITRMDELVALFHGGDEEIQAALRRMWEEQGDQLRAQYGPPPQVQAYLERARAARQGGGTS
jgi:MerR family transcriptional regulator, thiopeptide resistance regulator